jgi:hypothetical protein
MNTTIGVFQNLGYAATHYTMSNTTLAMQKDLKQSLAIGFFAAERIAVLVEQMKLHTSSLDFKFRWAPYTLGILAGVALPLSQKHLAKHPNPTTPAEKILNKTCKLIKALGTVSYKILQHTDKLINVACFVNAIALIALGFPMAGSIALFGLFILLLKRRLLLPASVERVMEPILLVAGIATTITMPMHLFFKVLNIVIYAISASTMIANSKRVRARLPARFKNPFHNKHVIPPEEAVFAAELAKTDDYKDYDFIQNRFHINTSHIYSDEVGKILPTELDQSLNAVSATTLFNQLRTDIQAAGIILDQDALDGLRNLETCATTGSVADVSPPNITLFQKILKALLQAVLADKQNFGIKVPELANVGNSCVEGWTRDITSILSPSTNEVRWAVHNVLSKRRGEIIKEEVRKNNTHIPVLDLAGGSNDVHTTNAVQGALWHRYRPYEAELFYQLNQPSALRVTFIRNVLIKNIAKSKLLDVNSQNNANSNLLHANSKKIPTLIEHFYRSIAAAEVHPALATSPAGGLLGIMIGKIEPSVTKAIADADKTVDAIYDAIKAEYAPLPDPEGKFHPKRTIDWNIAVLPWIGSFAERQSIELCDINGNFDPTWVAFDAKKQPYLTKAGVRLLLWDLGVLSMTPEP